METAASRVPTPPSSSPCPASPAPTSSRSGRLWTPTGRGTSASESSPPRCSSCLRRKRGTRSPRTVSNVKI